MCRVIAIANQKGGVGKTTTAINLGIGLVRQGKRVLLVDLNPQGHLTIGLGFSKKVPVTLKNMLENIVMGIKFDPREVILHHEEGVDVNPSNKLLSGLDVSLIMAEDREIILREYLMLLKEDYDFMIIDCMPSLGMLTIKALTAADSVLIPMEPEYYAADGLTGIVKSINQEDAESEVQNSENHNSEVVKNNILEFSKSQSNKTNINKTDNNQSILSKNVDLSEDEMDKINHYRKIVKEQISYTAFEQNKFYRIELVDELVELMTEIFMMPDESFERVNGTEKSIAVIKSRM